VCVEHPGIVRALRPARKMLSNCKWPAGTVHWLSTAPELDYQGKHFQK
jgi:hypothetical protein